MKAVILDFNGTMIFDSALHVKAWTEIYYRLHPNDTSPFDASLVCGPNNDSILQAMAPQLTPAHRAEWSEEKEALYRAIASSAAEPVGLVDGVEGFLQYLQEQKIPYGLASASIKSNIDYYFEVYGLDRWFKKDQVVYDDGTYAHKGAMHLECARRLGVHIRDCLLIEDSAGSVAHAKAAGAGRVIAIGISAPKQKLLSVGADHYMADFTEFDHSWLHL